MPLFIQETDKGLVFKVKVQPKSSKNKISGLHGDALKIRLTAPPVEGEANKMCLAFLAKSLGVSKSSLEILAGQSSRDKRILIAAAKDDAPARAQARKAIEALAGNTV